MGKKLTDSSIPTLTSNATNDLLMIVDVSDTSGDPAGTSKKIAASNLTNPGPLRNVADRTSYPYSSLAGNFQSMGRCRHGIMTGGTQFILVFPNFLVLTGAEGTAGGPATMTASIEKMDGTLVQATFNGLTTGTVADKAYLYSDPITVSIAEGEQIFVRHWRNCAGGGFFGQDSFLNVGPNNAHTAPLSASYATGECYQLGATVTDRTASTGVFGDTNGSMFRPCMILGYSDKQSLWIQGDSKCVGQSDAHTDGFLSLGNTTKSFDNLVAYTNLSVGGEQLFNLTSAAGGPASMTLRLTTVPYYTAAIEVLGTNDVATGSRSALNFLTDLASYVTKMAPLPVYAATISPLASSTNNWIDDAGQTPNAGNAARIVVNDALRAGAPSSTGFGGQRVAGYFDYADAVESFRNSGRWKHWPTARAITDAAIDIGVSATTLNSASAAFTQEDNGIFVNIGGAGVAGAAILVRMQYTGSATSCTILTAASTTVSGATAQIGAQMYTVDGTHERSYGYLAVKLANAFTPWKFIR